MIPETRYPSSVELPEIRLNEVDFFADPWDGYAKLRQEAPVFWYDPAACWVVSRYDDVKRVCQDQETFSTIYGATLGPQFAAVAEVHGSGDLADRTRRLVAARDAA